MMEEKLSKWKLQEYIPKFKALYVIESLALRKSLYLGASYVGVSEGSTGGATGPHGWRTGVGTPVDQTTAVLWWTKHAAFV